MRNKWKKGLVFLSLLGAPWVHGATCQPIKHKDGEIIRIQSALFLGGRIQLPGNLVAKPLASNNHLWDVDGMIGSSSIFIKPNSSSKEGQRTMIFATTDEGKVYDIQATRVSGKRNQPCIIVSEGSRIFSEEQQQALSTFMHAQTPQSSAVDRGQIERLEKALSQAQKSSQTAVKNAVVNALKKYQYRIYTRYQWNEGREFVGRNTISDVYDDGQFTYIRLANPNRGILSVETTIGGKRAIAPTRYIDTYGMYKVTGIYPSFTLRIDEVTIDVQRRDNHTKGNT